MKNSGQEKIVEQDGVKMLEIRRKSPLPFYGAAAAWLLYSLGISMYRFLDILLAALLSVGVYLLFSKLFPGKTERVPLPDLPPAATGIPHTDALLRQGDACLRELGDLNGQIPDPELSESIRRIEETTRKIFDQVAKQPEKASEISKLMNYYLPTAAGLLRSYVNMQNQGIEGKHITATMGDIRQVMETVASALERQLDALFHQEALDASVEIQVLRTMLAREGLSESDFPSKN